MIFQVKTKMFDCVLGCSSVNKKIFVFDSHFQNEPAGNVIFSDMRVSKIVTQPAEIL